MLSDVGLVFFQKRRKARLVFLTKAVCGVRIGNAAPKIGDFFGVRSLGGYAFVSAFLQFIDPAAEGIAALGECIVFLEGIRIDLAGNGMDIGRARRWHLSALRGRFSRYSRHFRSGPRRDCDSLRRGCRGRRLDTRKLGAFLSQWCHALPCRFASRADYAKLTSAL